MVLFMIKLSYDIKNYRKQILDLTQNGDTIIELGCHVGNTTKILLDNFRDSKIMALDNSPEATIKMNEILCDNLEFINAESTLIFNRIAFGDGVKVPYLYKPFYSGFCTVLVLWHIILLSF